MNKEIYILGGARTPMADYTGKLKDFSALDLGGLASRAAMARTNVAPEMVDHVVFGNVLQTSSDAVYGARHVGLKAGVPIDVPALTVNRLCGSGIQSAISGGQMILLGEADVVLAGGTENMSQAPHVIRGLRSGLRLGQGQLEDYLWTSLLDPSLRLHDGRHGRELRGEIRHLARGAGSVCAPQPAPRRCRVEGGALRRGGRRRSRSRAARASSCSRPTTTCGRTRRSRDWRSCPAAFSKNGCVTAGNASGIVDGAAAILLASERGVKTHGLTPIGRLTHWATVGVDPSLMGMGPAPGHAQGAREGGSHAEGPRPHRGQ